jgi:hypothetical protein
VALSRPTFGAHALAGGPFQLRRAGTIRQRERRKQARRIETVFIFGNLWIAVGLVERSHRRRLNDLGDGAVIAAAAASLLRTGRELDGFLRDDPMMRKLRFNIASLLRIVLFLAVGFAALREAGDLWEGGLFTLTVCVLLLSILLAVHCREGRRAFWIGFALFGWVYLGFTLVPSIDERLATTKALLYLDSKVPGRSLGVFKVHFTGAGSGVTGNSVQSVAFSPDGSRVVVDHRGVLRLWDTATGRLLGGWSGTTENRVRIGHSLLALLAGWFGAALSRRLRRVSVAPEEATEHP